MKNSNKLQKTLSKIISKLEISLQLSNILDLEIVDFAEQIPDCASKLKLLLEKQRSQKLPNNVYTDIISCMSRFCIVSERSTFNREKVLDFSYYERSDVLLSYIIDMVDEESVIEFTQDKVYYVFKILEIAENSRNGITSSLSYRTVRMMCCLALNGFILESCIMSNFIKEQIFISMGFKPRMQYSKVHSDELGVIIERENKKFLNKFSSRIKEKIKSEVGKVNNKVDIYEDDSRTTKVFKSIAKDVMDKFDDGIVGDRIVVDTNSSERTIDYKTIIEEETDNIRNDELYDEQSYKESPRMNINRNRKIYRRADTYDNNYDDEYDSYNLSNSRKPRSSVRKIISKTPKYANSNLDLYRRYLGMYYDKEYCEFTRDKYSILSNGKRVLNTLITEKNLNRIVSMYESAR